MRGYVRTTQITNEEHILSGEPKCLLYFMNTLLNKWSIAKTFFGTAFQISYRFYNWSIYELKAIKFKYFVNLYTYKKKKQKKTS